MGFLDRLEKAIESVVSGVFARAFKGDVEPMEIAARLQKELDAEAKLLSRDRKLAPNEFFINLSEHDYNALEPYGRKTTDLIVPELRSHAQNMGYIFNGPLEIHYELVPELPTGKFTVESRAVAGVDRDELDSRVASRRARMVIEVNGVRHPLVPPGIVIGRGTEADLRIHDPGVSRKHAQIKVTGLGFDLEYEIIDLGARNGMTVDGRKVKHAVLADGSRIEIGSTKMLVHAPAGR
ncbi:FhaA domain-containing protein [Granulicoccus sp. GXG6511]|uniref:FhaA domain-containing protein n=1 Tax=Granulicoccus sp. GXG6511 TaxID=3381351 RepID=UPI003D7E9354